MIGVTVEEVNQNAEESGVGGLRHYQVVAVSRASVHLP